MRYIVAPPLPALCWQCNATLAYMPGDIDPLQGGATRFDLLNLAVQPQKGKAVLFFPALSDGTSDPRHVAALPLSLPGGLLPLELQTCNLWRCLSDEAMTTCSMLRIPLSRLLLQDTAHGRGCGKHQVGHPAVDCPWPVRGSG
jgi:hypothetical protein